MAASRQEISGWFDEGLTLKMRFMLVVCDTFDHEDYPVFLKDGENAREAVTRYSAMSMQRVMECYDLTMDKSKQMAEHRAWHYGDDTDEA